MRQEAIIMYIFIPFFFFIWGGLTVAYFHFGFQPEWLATILNTSSAGDSAANAFMLSTRGGLFIIGVGVFCLIWIVVRLWLGIDKFEEPQDSGSLREDIVEIFDALLTPIPSPLQSERNWKKPETDRTSGFRQMLCLRQKV